MIDCRAYSSAQTGSGHGSSHAIVRARVQIRKKVTRLSNRSVKRDATKLKITALENLPLELRRRFEGLELDDDASSEDEWREPKDADTDASQVHLGRTGSLVK